MVRARLPSIAKRLIQFECGADATVQFRGAVAFPIRPLRAWATLDQTETFIPPRTWQITFEPRAARPGRDVPASSASRPPVCPAVKSHQVGCYKGGSQPGAATIASGWLREREQYPFVAMRKNGFIRTRWSCCGHAPLPQFVDLPPSPPAYRLRGRCTAQFPASKQSQFRS
jgi:hypothetical protein